MKSSCPTSTSVLLLPLLLSYLPYCIAQSTNSTFPKRGLCYIGTDSSERDASIFTHENSPLTWYYNYSPWPGPSSSLARWTTEFVPMVHSASDAHAAVDTIQSILNGSLNVGIASSPSSRRGNHIQHVLTFNEPDGDTSSGGSDSSPSHAAQVWLDTIAPLRAPPYNLRVSLPATTGSGRGLEWLRDFNASCYRLNRMAGCAFDFVAAHWYGDFVGLSSWLGQLREVYPDKPIWVTEFAIPSVTDDETEAFMNQSLPYLDGLDYVDRYSWFGAFREDEANEWTGDAVSLFDRHGGLTDLGALWMGGLQNGFEEGTSAGDDDDDDGGGGGDSGGGVLRWDSRLLVLWLVIGIMGYIW
ncbi:hypothetical protein A1O7_09811 [Cladophialophora yegresii CBS 114405]|uniref:Asl1-like glycosyl hydrolase catalytic domain-containing protein n=1 Tax=Cladophialophora yegresii CBS 114405 TaxID=1182544 RepID=W9VQP4_9EURO|nr:uncharacterized protein A1O7_09811 [Cladophialophora yegresii CBS 114405]EXJ54471.1 hypothetical protein A1O7_09811 [Cladophialophora yegresii CBS 114405]